MDVLFVVAEAHPFVKTGGLGDVGGSLPGALRGKNINIRVVLPKYGLIPQIYRESMEHLTDFRVDLAWRNLYCGVEKLELEGVHYYFIDNEYYFKRDGLYGYHDDAERFIFFNKAVLECLSRMGDFRPKIIHCNDWHTSLIPFMLKHLYFNEPYYSEIKTLFTIHNLKHQGRFPLEVFESVLGFHLDEKAWKGVEYHGGANFLKSALLTADLLSTVSPSYAGEIQNPYFGEGLDGVLRSRHTDLYGILNGIDLKEYPPPGNGSHSKGQLQERLNLPVRKDVPLLAFISRLVEQKGLDLLAGILEEILQQDIQLVVLGTGEHKYEEMFRHFVGKYPDKLALRLLFDHALAREIYEGADIFLMPSKFEPCGLSQMIAMRYGTIPIVRETGGLKDSVLPYNKYTGEGNGFSFANYNAHEFLFAVQRAVRLFYEDKPFWDKLMKNAMKSNFSWEKSAVEYIKLYRQMQ